ncbi:MAG: hypothetical protein WCC60_16120 [Ilumatobacteraceae bacterium]
MNMQLIQTTPKPSNPATGTKGYTATDDLWPTNRVAGSPATKGYTATDDLWK